MNTLARRVLSYAGLFVGAALLTAGVLWIARDKPDTQIISVAPVMYESFEDAQADSDATLEIHVLSEDGTYVDFGSDGKPNYDGDPGLTKERITAEVLSVLDGDESLVGSEITVTQLPSTGNSESDLSTALKKDKTYLIIGSRYSNDPNISGEYWVTPLAGQGVFEISDGLVQPNRGVFEETLPEPISISDLESHLS